MLYLKMCVNLYPNLYRWGCWYRLIIATYSTERRRSSDSGWMEAVREVIGLRTDL